MNNETGKLTIDGEVLICVKPNEPDAEPIQMRTSWNHPLNEFLPPLFETVI